MSYMCLLKSNTLYRCFLKRNTRLARARLKRRTVDRDRPCVRQRWTAKTDSPAHDYGGGGACSEHRRQWWRQRDHRRHRVLLPRPFESFSALPRPLPPRHDFLHHECLHTSTPSGSYSPLVPHLPRVMLPSSPARALRPRI
jgi:hypothetical protein